MKQRLHACKSARQNHKADGGETEYARSDSENQRSLGDSHCVDENYEEAIRCLRAYLGPPRYQKHAFRFGSCRTDPRFYQLGREEALKMPEASSCQTWSRHWFDRVKRTLQHRRVSSYLIRTLFGGQVALETAAQRDSEQDVSPLQRMDRSVSGT
jgi:hypothetical protein